MFVKNAFVISIPHVISFFSLFFFFTFRFQARVLHIPWNRKPFVANVGFQSKTSSMLRVKIIVTEYLGKVLCVKILPKVTEK